MSARALNWAWAQTPKTTSQKLVLAALADRADDEGLCFPSVAWVSTKCSPMPHETTRRVIRELAEQGLVEKVKRRATDGKLGAWLYRLPLERQTDQRAPVNGGQIESDQRAPVNARQRAPVNEPACTSARAEPSIEPKSSPDGEDAAARSRDLVWDALVAWVGHEPISPTERRGWNKVVRDLKEAGATGESVEAATRAYTKTWPEMERSPYAIEKWWGRFLQEGGGSNVRAAVLAWARNVGVHLEGPGLDDELLSWAKRGADDVTLAEAKRIATQPIEKLAAT